jgi:hypothetical protein
MQSILPVFAIVFDDFLMKLLCHPSTNSLKLTPIAWIEVFTPPVSLGLLSQRLLLTAQSLQISRTHLCLPLVLVLIDDSCHISINPIEIKVNQLVFVSEIILFGKLLKRLSITLEL